MQVITSIEEMQRMIQQAKRNQQTIGFVPTMGFLHEGHLSLVEKAREQNDLVVMSIFVNPLQFGANEDFSSYPRNEARDEQLAEKANVDILFLPNVKEMYRGKRSFELQVMNRVNVLCGASRPGHFDGVATVLIKLFNLISPTHAYFGLKDAQQVAVVSALIDEFNFPIKLLAVPTMREEDGLAQSSRNVYLTAKERAEAIWINQSLMKAKQLMIEGERKPLVIVQEIRQLIENKTSGKIDYINILSYPNLESIDVLEGTVIIAIAVKFSKARLIDNHIVKVSGKEVIDYVSYDDEQ